MAFYPYATLDGAAFHVVTGAAAGAVSVGDVVANDGSGQYAAQTANPIASAEELFVAANAATAAGQTLKLYRTGPNMIFRNVAAGALNQGDEYTIDGSNMQVTTTAATIANNPAAEVYRTIDSGNNEYAVIIKRRH